MYRIVEVRQRVKAIESTLTGFRSEFYATSKGAKGFAIQVVNEHNKTVKAVCAKYGLTHRHSTSEEIGRAWKRVAHLWNRDGRTYFIDRSSDLDHVRILRSLIDGVEVTYNLRDLSSFIDAELWMRTHNRQLIEKLYSNGFLRQLNPLVPVAVYAYRESKNRREWYY